MSVARTFRLAAIQLAVQAEKQVNLGNLNHKEWLDLGIESESENKNILQ